MVAPVPETVTVYEPTVVDEQDKRELEDPPKVRTLAVSPQTSPVLGLVESDNETEPLNPFTLVAVTLVELESPTWKVTELAIIAKAKSCTR